MKLRSTLILLIAILFVGCSSPNTESPGRGILDLNITPLQFFWSEDFSDFNLITHPCDKPGGPFESGDALTSLAFNGVNGSKAMNVSVGPFGRGGINRQTCEGQLEEGAQRDYKAKLKILPGTDVGGMTVMHFLSTYDTDGQAPWGRYLKLSIRIAKDGAQYRWYVRHDSYYEPDSYSDWNFDRVYYNKPAVPIGQWINLRVDFRAEDGFNTRDQIDGHFFFYANGVLIDSRPVALTVSDPPSINSRFTWFVGAESNSQLGDGRVVFDNLQIDN